MNNYQIMLEWRRMMTTIGIGERLTIIQGDRSQNKFALDVDIPSGTIGRWKNEKTSPQLEDLEKICEKCNIRIVWLVTGEGPMYKTDQPYNPAITASDENKENEQKQIEPLVTVLQEFTDKTDQCCNMVIAALEEHKKQSNDQQEQIAPPQVAPQEPQGMPFRTQLAVFCCVLAIFFALVANKSEVDFFTNYSVFGLLLCCVIGYFCIALPHIEDWFYPPGNLGV